MSHEAENLLEIMLAAAKRDPATDLVDGRPSKGRIEGVRIRPLNTHVDRRGSVFEMFDQRWNWSDAPVGFAYCFTVRAGTVKGWGLHEHHEDRYCLIKGEIDLVLFDPRPTSPTFRQIDRIQLSYFHRCLVAIPPYVWHADHNVGREDAIVVNFPTAPYDHARPDKLRLPIDTDLIPYDFGEVSGG